MESVQEYIDLITDSHTQVEFINNLADLFGGLPYSDLLIQQDASGVNHSVDLLSYFGLNLSSYTSTITEMVPNIVDNLKTYHDMNYTDYLSSLQTITFSDLLN